MSIKLAAAHAWLVVQSSQFFRTASLAITVVCGVLLPLGDEPRTAGNEVNAKPPGEDKKNFSQTAELSNLASANALILVVGAPGKAEFGEEFESWADRWQALALERDWPVVSIGHPPTDAADKPGPESTEGESDRERLRQAIAKQAAVSDRLWIVLLGHGTFAGNVAKFNLVGPDVSANDLQEWLGSVDKPAVVLNCSSASSPFLPQLSAAKRVIVTATRSGSEFNYSRFGGFVSELLSDMSADLDHDQELSLLEVFLAANARTQRFYREQSRLASEHALIEDNGDGVGSSGDFYRGMQVIQRAADDRAVDGRLASRLIVYSSPQAIQLSSEQKERRSEIERQIDRCRALKASLPEAEYYAKLEPLMLEMAQLYDQAERETTDSR